MISTLTKTGMLHTLKDIVKTYVEKQNSTHTKSALKDITHTELLLKLFQKEIEQEEPYMLEIEEHLNECIENHKKSNIFYRGLSYAVNSVWSLISNTTIHPQSFINHINSYDYSSVDAIGKLYLKVVLSELYAKSKNSDYQFNYTLVSANYNLTDKLHSSIKNIVEAPDIQYTHIQKYYKDIKNFKKFGRYEERIYNLDRLIADCRKSIEHITASTNREYNTILTKFEHVYPTFTNMDKFLDYYEKTFIDLKSINSSPLLGLACGLFISAIVAFLVTNQLSGALEFIMQLIKSNINDSDKAIKISKWISEYVSTMNLTNITHIFPTINKLAIHFMSFLVNGFGIDGSTSTYQNYALKFLYIVIYIIQILISMGVGAVINYIFDPSTKTYKVGADDATQDMDELNEEYTSIMKQVGNIKYDIYNNMEALYTTYIKSKTKENLNALYAYYLNNVRETIKSQIINFKIYFKNKYSTIEHSNLLKYQTERFEILSSFASGK